ncbi:hypothetical protein, partial [Alicyclobacillus ferrooxydans]
FAAAFLQIPPRGGHPWLELMATATFTTPDFHRIDNAHAGRTNKIQAAVCIGSLNAFGSIAYLLFHFQVQNTVCNRGMYVCPRLRFCILVEFDAYLAAS